MKVLEHKDAIIYLKKRNISRAYLKAKKHIESGNYELVSLRKREPKSQNIWYFRITKKYRGFARLNGDELVVFHISDHQ